MKTALVSAHIFKQKDSETEIEILSRIDDDNHVTGIFDDLDHALLEQVEPEFDSCGSFFFMALIRSEFVRHTTLDGDEYDVEHEVTVIKNFDDLRKLEKPDQDEKEKCLKWYANEEHYMGEISKLPILRDNGARARIALSRKS